VNRLRYISVHKCEYIHIRVTGYKGIYNVRTGFVGKQDGELTAKMCGPPHRSLQLLGRGERARSCKRGWGAARVVGGGSGSWSPPLGVQKICKAVQEKRFQSLRPLVGE
jgi:hypothetical protein